MQNTLKEKVAIVTGGNAGIGKAIATTFASQGATVIIFGTNKERGESVVNEINANQENPKASFHQVNVSNLNETKEAIDAVIKEYGGVDVLVNNAGITRDNLLLKMSEEDWNEVMDVNLKSVYNTCKTVVRSMMKSRKGKIINISSVIGLTGNAGQINYAASKSGMLGFTKSLAKEIASRNVSVNCIAPGYIETRMTDTLDEKQKGSILEQIPMRRIGKPEDIANVALFLASEMADYITGQCLTVDGGMVTA